MQFGIFTVGVPSDPPVHATLRATAAPALSAVDVPAAPAS